MLKFYVETINRLGRSTKFILRKSEDRDGQDGFASAETIALAVAGVLIAGVAYTFFSDNIDGWLSNITGVFDDFGSSP